MNPTLCVDTSVSTLRCGLLQLDATPASVLRFEFAQRFARRHAAALCAMFVSSRAEESPLWASPESPAALLRQMERGDIDRATSRFDDALAG